MKRSISVATLFVVIFLLGYLGAQTADDSNLVFFGVELPIGKLILAQHRQEFARELLLHLCHHLREGKIHRAEVSQFAS